MGIEGVKNTIPFWFYIILSLSKFIWITGMFHIFYITLLQCCNTHNLYKISLQNHTFAKFNFAIFYHPPYKQLFGWEKSLSNLDVNKHVLVLTKLLWTSLKILFHTKQLALMTKGTCLFVPEGTNKLKHLSWRKTLSVNVWCKNIKPLRTYYSTEQPETTRNDLKQPTLTKSDLKRPITTWKDLQRARNNQQQPQNDLQRTATNRF